MEYLSVLGSRPGLERITSLLHQLGDPQLGLKCIHIAGTNGKGSTSLIISEMLTAAGYRVGRFTSPHLHSYTERITIDGTEITETDFLAGLENIESSIRLMLESHEEHPTEFEILTALAFQYFARQKVDLVVLEVGLGGTYDSTNVIIPLLAVITGVDYDHTGFLGTSLAEIAANKAGIIKAGVPVVSGAMPQEAWQVIMKRAVSLRAPLYCSSSITIERAERPGLDGQVLDISGTGLRLLRVKFSLCGDYQLGNLAAALAAVQLLRGMGYRVDEAAVRKSLAALKIPGRMEVISRDPLVMVDAAHNPQGARALADSLDNLLPGRQKVLVMGLVDDKERDGIIQALALHTKLVVVTRPEGPRGSHWLEVGERWRHLYPDVKVVMEENIPAAVRAGLGQLDGDAYLLVTGSFYVLDQARRFLKNN